MTNKKNKTGSLVVLGENSQFKIDLNRGVASLSQADKNYLRPHWCLNGEEGIEVVERIFQEPDNANTEFWINDNFILSSDDMWLNISFAVFLGKISFPNDMVRLTPRQSSFIVKNLSEKSQMEVLKAIKTWYFEKVLKNLQKGIATLSAQFEKDLLVESAHSNRIFDLPSPNDSGSDTPYTEIGLVGERLAPNFLYGSSCFDSMGEYDGYSKADD